MITHKNPIISQLSRLGVIDTMALEQYASRVRDRDDVSVVRCSKSGVIALSSADHIGFEYYKEKDREVGFTDLEQGNVAIAELQDCYRRANFFGDRIKGKHWLDIGTGTGQILDALKDKAKSATGVEPHKRYRNAASARGLQVLPHISDTDDSHSEVVTLFHVFEHIIDPIATLEEIKTKMKSGGELVLEVPHAKDFLLETLSCDAFRAFTLWSEHLVLHTAESLEKIIRAAGFSSIRIEGYQRYPLSNHLYWLCNSAPGGHEVWSHLHSDDLQKSYSRMLMDNGQTDTLIAYATRP